MIQPADALKLIANAPDGKAKTPAALREAAEDCESQAERKLRLVVGSGNRRSARQKAREREAEKLKVYAQLTRMAADEVERRKCETVGEAMRPWVVRLLTRPFNRMAIAGA